MRSPHDPERPRPPTPGDDAAVFLDVDGCLLELADHPDAVVVPDSLHDDLSALSDRLDGALALVSGRSLADIDALFAPLRLPAAGLHGLEWRNAGASSGPPEIPDALDTIHREAQALAARHPGALVEEKGAALGLHWRGATNASTHLRAFAEAALSRLPGYRLQDGNHVVELRPAHGDKGTAVRALLEQPPFRGRTPFFAGDDITDESAFVAVNALDGLSILVGGREPSAARYALQDPRAVRDWLVGKAPSIPFPS